MTDEQLIELVKQYPVLYDISLGVSRDYTVRNNAWEEIAEQLNADVEFIKNKWGKLRNCFTNALKRRRKKIGQTGTYMVPWKFEKQMEFLVPHVEWRSSVTNLGDTIDDDSTPDFDSKYCDESLLSPLTILHTPKSSSTVTESVQTDVKSSFTANESTQTVGKGASTETIQNGGDRHLLRELVDAMKSSHDIRMKRPASDMDENDHFFLSMSKQIRRLPQADQAEIKFQIHKLIYDSEMKMLNNHEEKSNT